MKIRIWSSILLAVIFLSASNNTSVTAAIKKLEVNPKEYNLQIDDLPSGITDSNLVYAKFSSSKQKASGYAISFFDDYDSVETTETALKKAGQKLEDLQVFAMQILMYQADKEGDYYPVEKDMNVTIICPVPDDMTDQSSDIQIFRVNAKKLEKVNHDLVSVEGVQAVKFEITKFSVYAFVSGAENIGGTASKNTPIPTKTPEITKKPEVTAIPTQKPESITKVPARPSATKIPVRDKTPQTGDSSRMKNWTVLGIGSVILFGWAVVHYKRK